EGHARAPRLEAQGDEKRGEEGAEVDDPVEGVVDPLRQVLVGLVELVAHEGGDAGLDAAGSEGDEEEAGVEAGAVRLEEGQAGVAGAVDQTQVEDGPVLAQPLVGEPSAEEGKEVHPHHEEVEDLLRLGFANGELSPVEQEIADEDLGEDVSHPVEAEALAGLVADDEGDLPGEAPSRLLVAAFGHRPSPYPRRAVRDRTN